MSTRVQNPSEVHACQFCYLRIPGVASRYTLALQVLCVIAIVSLFACNKRERGCLDLEALNFDVTAEASDPGDCDYPSLFLNVTYDWADTIFRTGLVYTNNLGQDLAIDRFHYLLSQFSIQRSNAPDLRVSDITDWFIAEGTSGKYIDALNDLAYVDRSTFNFSLGTKMESGLATGCSFWSAVPDSLLPTVIDSMPAGSKARDSRALYDPSLQQFANGRFIVTRFPQNTTDTFDVYAGPLNYTFPLSKELNRGYHDTIRIALDLESLFGDIDLDQSHEVIVEHLRQNINQSILDNN